MKKSYFISARKIILIIFIFLNVKVFADPSLTIQFNPNPTVLPAVAPGTTITIPISFSAIPTIDGDVCHFPEIDFDLQFSLIDASGGVTQIPGVHSMSYCMGSTYNPQAVLCYGSGPTSCSFIVPCVSGHYWLSIQILNVHMPAICSPGEAAFSANATDISTQVSHSYSTPYTYFENITSWTCSFTNVIEITTIPCVNPPNPVITPSGPTTFCQGNSVVLNANSGACSYQWYRFGTLLTGATNSNLTATQSGNYIVFETNACGSASTLITVTVLPLPPATITPGGQLTFCQGGFVFLQANTGTGLSYQWKLNGVDIPLATNSGYSATQQGNYTVVVTNSCGNTTSSPILVNISNPSAIITTTV